MTRSRRRRPIEPVRWRRPPGLSAVPTSPANWSGCAKTGPSDCSRRQRPDRPLEMSAMPITSERPACSRTSVSSPWARAQSRWPRGSSLPLGRAASTTSPRHSIGSGLPSCRFVRMLLPNSLNSVRRSEVSRLTAASSSQPGTMPGQSPASIWHSSRHPKSEAFRPSDDRRLFSGLASRPD